MPNEVLASIVGEDASIALGAQELDVIEDVFEGFIGFAQRAQSRVEDAAVNHVAVVEFVLQITPTGAFRNKEAIVVVWILTVLFLGILEGHTLLDLAPDNLFVLGVEHVRATFQEQHPEDVILVGGRIEALLTQPVRGGVEMTFKFGEREAWHESKEPGQADSRSDFYTY